MLVQDFLLPYQIGLRELDWKVCKELNWTEFIMKFIAFVLEGNWDHNIIFYLQDFLSNKELSEHFTDYEARSHKFWELPQKTFSQNIFPTKFPPFGHFAGKLAIQNTHILPGWVKDP